MKKTTHVWLDKISIYSSILFFFKVHHLKVSQETLVIHSEKLPSKATLSIWKYILSIMGIQRSTFVKIIEELADFNFESHSAALEWEICLTRISENIVRHMFDNNNEISSLPFLENHRKKIYHYFIKRAKEDLHHLIYFYVLIRIYRKCTDIQDHIIFYRKHSLFISATTSDYFRDIKIIFYLNPLTSFQLIFSPIMQRCRYMIRRRRIRLSSQFKSRNDSLVNVGYHITNCQADQDILPLLMTLCNSFDNRAVAFIDHNTTDGTPPPTRKKWISFCNKYNIPWISWTKQTDTSMDDQEAVRKQLPSSPHASYLPLKELHQIKHYHPWFYRTWNTLLNDVRWWLDIFHLTNVLVYLDYGAQHAETIAQSIALDIKGGMRIGFQKSALSSTQYLPFLYDNTNHIYFTWGPELSYHQHTNSCIRSMICCGYPFMTVREPCYDMTHKEDNGDFNIILFDNIYNPYVLYSRQHIKSFYRTFIEWMVEDPAVHLIIKPKRRHTFHDLFGAKYVETLLSHHRVQLLHHSPTQLTQYSEKTHMVVGIGISTAATELVRLGYRAILVDHTYKKGTHSAHPYYQSGYETIIFDDPKRALNALKDYKKDRKQHASLGDWSRLMYQLDPYSDTKALDRVKYYLEVLLSKLNQSNTTLAIRHANTLFAQKYGNDKLLETSRII